MEFLANKWIAVTGVSRNPQGHCSNMVYQRLRERGYEVFPVNPKADQVEGDKCYLDLKSIPGGVGAVVIGTRPRSAEATMHECAESASTIRPIEQATGYDSQQRAFVNSQALAGQVRSGTRPSESASPFDSHFREVQSLAGLLKLHPAWVSELRSALPTLPASLSTPGWSPTCIRPAPTNAQASTIPAR